jgi:hypothetical protein
MDWMIQKRHTAYFITVLVAVIAVMSIAPVYAQEIPVLDEGHINRIRSNCPSAIATLSRIHANDGPVFINRNQTYFSVGDKLMARFNSRLILNRHDATQLVKTTSDYNAQLIKFRDAYKKYEESMNSVLRMDCRQQPVEFYTRVEEVRLLRQKVHENIVLLKAFVGQYRQNVEDFEKQFQTKERS